MKSFFFLYDKTLFIHPNITLFQPTVRIRKKLFTKTKINWTKKRIVFQQFVTSSPFRNLMYRRVEGFVFVIICCCWVSSVYLSEKLLRIKFFTTLWVILSRNTYILIKSNNLGYSFLCLKCLIKRKDRVVWIVCCTC